MPKPTPTLGYPSKTAAVKALRAQGHSHEAIAEQTGMATKTVYALEQNLFYAKRPRSIVLDWRTIEQLRRPAMARGMSERELALRVLSAAAAAGMVDTILGDRDG